MRDFLRLLRRRHLVLIYTVAAMVAFAVGISLVQPSVYAAKATVLVPSDVRQSVDQNRQAFTSLDLLDRALTNEISFAEGDRVQAAAHDRLGYVPSVVVTPIANTDSLAFVAKSTDPARAALQANTYAKTYLQERRRAKTTDFLNTAKTLAVEINSLRDRRAKLKSSDPRVSGIQASIESLQQSLGDLRASGELSKVGGSILRAATTPASPVSPNIVRNGVVAGLLGVVLGVLLAFTRDRFDDSVGSKEQLEAAGGGKTVMALIPQFGSGPLATREQVVASSRPNSPLAEAYQLLRASIQIRNQLDGGTLRAIAVTSPRPGEGKTSTVANLGVALARTGQRVVIVDFDLRRPRIEAFFGVTSKVGIISLLVGDSELSDALVDVDGQRGLSIVPAGPLPADPSEILASERAHALIQELRGRADFILIDCPPVLPVPDALAIAQMVDGVILVAAAQRTSKRSIARAVELLEQVDAPLIGSVLNEVRGGGEDDYGYGQYYAAFSARPESNGRRARWRARRETDLSPPSASPEAAGFDEPDLDRGALGRIAKRDERGTTGEQKRTPPKAGDAPELGDAAGASTKA